MNQKWIGTIYDASPKLIDWDQLMIKLGCNCKACGKRAVYSYYREEKVRINWMGQIGYLTNYALDYGVCEEHKNWKNTPK